VELGVEEDVPWEGQMTQSAWEFGLKCAELRRSNPYELVALDWIINALMTELWDNGFSQSEIRAAFERAVADMSRYAAGEERRGGRAEF
jgi:hypothetical protein